MKDRIDYIIGVALLTVAFSLALWGCGPPQPPPPVAYGPTVVVLSCALNEEQIQHTIGVTDSRGFYRVHWYDSPSGPSVTQWQQMVPGVGYRFVGFGRGQVEWTAELDGSETIAAPAYQGFWSFGPYPSCTQKASV